MRKILSKATLTGTRGHRAILFFAMGLGAALCHSARAEQSVTLAWNASPTASVAGYMISYGSDGINFSNQVDAGDNTKWTVAGLQDGSTNYFAVSAYDTNYNESLPSAPVEYVAPILTETVAVAASPAGAGGVSGGGSFVSGSSVTVTAAANSGYTFANWTENGTVQSASRSYSFTLAANRNLTANFTANPVTNTVAVAASPAGAGSVSGGGSFVSGSSVTVTAAANSGYTFANWTENGTVQSASRSYSFTLAANRNLTANFTNNPVFFTVTPGAGANGIIRPGGPQTVASGGSVTFTATPGSNYLVQQWLVNGSAVQVGGASYTLGNVTGNRSVMVTFIQNTTASTNTTNSNTTNSNTNSLLTVLVSGNGTVTPNLNGRMLAGNRRFNLLATAATGCVFSNWTSNGVVVAGGPAHAFVMASGLVLQANFVTNPFPAVAGNYEGLFYDTNNVAQESSGACNATITSRGTFTAKLKVGSQSLAFSGQFTPDGRSFNTILRAGSASLKVQLQLGLTSGGLTGQVVGSNWTAELIAGPVTSQEANPAPKAGKYTLVIPGVRGSSTQPCGDGFGSVTLGTGGTVNFSGVLADGTPMTSAAKITGPGLWPFYAPLYAGRGSVIGWLAFDTNGDISGRLNWIKPVQPGARYYRGGFTNCATAIGSAYSYTNGAPVLGFSSGEVLLAGGNLPANFAEPIEIGGQNQKADLAQNKPAFTVSPSSGVLTGSVVDPQTGKPVAVKGIVLQNQQIAAGYFLGTSQSGQAVISPAP